MVVLSDKIYVFPHCKKKENEIRKIKGISRLFAFPVKPHFENEGELVILDSGAFGLSKQRRKISFGYMKKLNEYYLKFGQKNNVICVAPDEFLNPVQSMRNMQLWHKYNFYSKVGAVLQSSRQFEVNLEELKYQVDFYLDYTDIFLFSNPSLRGDIAKQLCLGELFYYIKEKGGKWIHILGGGWSLEDIQDWFEIDGFNSIDSIAYYTTTELNEFGSLDPIQNIYSIIRVMEEDDRC